MNNVKLNNKTLGIYKEKTRWLETLTINDSTIDKIDIKRTTLNDIKINNSTIDEISITQSRLKEISTLPQNLKTLNLQRNRIQKFNYSLLNNNLKYLNIGYNFLTEINNLPLSIEHLKCKSNFIKEIRNISGTQLRILNCGKCQINVIDDVPNTLTILKCNNNNLTSLPEESLRRCNDLIKLNYENNPNITISEAFLNHIDAHFTIVHARIELEQAIIQEEQRAMRLDEQRRNIVPLGTIYSDSQNVHSSKITKQMTENIKYLVNRSKKFNENISKLITETNIEFLYNKIEKTRYTNEILRDLRYMISLKSIHSVLKYTFEEIFNLVLNRIKAFEKDDIKIEMCKILYGLIREMKTVCFTGRMSRLISVLDHYDKNIKIQIDEKDQITAKYNISIVYYKELKKRTDDKNHVGNLVYNLLVCKKFQDLLEEININKETIDEWIYPFKEEIDDIIEEKPDVVKCVKPYIKNKDEYSNRYMGDIIKAYNRYIVNKNIDTQKNTVDNKSTNDKQTTIDNININDTNIDKQTTIDNININDTNDEKNDKENDKENDNENYNIFYRILKNINII